MTTLQDITAHFTSQELSSDTKLLVALHEKMVSNSIDVYRLLEGIGHIEYKDDVEVIFTTKYLFTNLGDMTPNTDLKEALLYAYAKAMSYIQKNKQVYSMEYGYGRLLPDVEAGETIKVEKVKDTSEPKKRGRKSPLYNGKPYSQVVSEIIQDNPNMLPKDHKRMIADTLGISMVYANTLHWNHFNKQPKVSEDNDDNLIVS